MTRLAPLALAAGLTLALPAQAFDVTQMNDDERAAFRAEVRSYLMENPEVILEAVNALEERNQQAQAQADVDLVKDNADAIFNDGFSWVGGNPDGDITVVEFLDYRCGYCRKAFEEVNELIADDGNIRFVVKEFPILGQASLDSSRFAVATKMVAGDEAYEMMHDALMGYNGATDEAALSRIAEGLGLDAEAIVAKLDDPAVADEIAETRRLANILKVSGTPTFVFQDQMVRGYVPLNAMEQIVEDQRGG
ncbi:DsbA family protein [Pseudooceanicola atlanticus]|uniref:DSBA oxidoreductase n=1 Tax=Pseudooceanicola atlanticus TaxID=1461694 RepID=A0A0A0EFF1_9RHOB|nr:DsbA family protein [Pseudooceanicola atlanticus]KGM47902.1 DSBA oxidoreductase [Pseudooceanicola atlanticus]